MTFDVSLEIQPALDALRSIRNSVAALRSDVKAAAKGPIRDHVYDDVTTLLAPYPERADGMFEFATPASRLWYLIAMRTGVFPSQNGLPWTRTLNLQESWHVEVDPQFAQFRAGDSTISITNNAVNELGRSYASAVYGPGAVQGHVDTGWGDNFETALTAITDHVTEDLLAALDIALGEFAS